MKIEIDIEDDAALIDVYEYKKPIHAMSYHKYIFINYEDCFSMLLNDHLGPFAKQALYNDVKCPEHIKQKIKLLELLE